MWICAFLNFVVLFKPTGIHYKYSCIKKFLGESARRENKNSSPSRRAVLQLNLIFFGDRCVEKYTYDDREFGQAVRRARILRERTVITKPTKMLAFCVESEATYISSTTSKASLRERFNLPFSSISETITLMVSPIETTSSTLATRFLSSWEM